MVFVLIALLVGIGLAIGESTFVNAVGIGGIKPDFAVLVVVVGTCRARFSRAMILAFSLGLARDLYSGSIPGMNAFSLTVTSYLLIAAEDYLMTNNWRGQFVVVFVGSVVYGFVFLSLKTIVGYELASFAQTLARIAWTAAYTAVLGPIIFMLGKHPERLPYLRLKMKYDVERQTIPQNKL